jgi:hypothetical protein
VKLVVLVVERVTGVVGGRVEASVIVVFRLVAGAPVERVLTSQRRMSRRVHRHLSRSSVT